MRMTFQPKKVLADLRLNKAAKQEDEEERKRIEHADRIRHALTVLDSLRSWNLESRRSQA
jgi:bacterioferritin (cytochrome b1)